MRLACVVVMLLVWSTQELAGQQPPAPCSGRLDELQILKLAAGQAPEADLLDLIRRCGSAIDVTPDVEKRLRAVGVTNRVLDALRATGHAPAQDVKGAEPPRQPAAPTSPPFPSPGFVTGIASDEFRKEKGFPLDQMGARVLRVLRGGPADRAGLRVGDIIVGLNGHPLTRVGGDVARRVEQDAAVGMVVRLEVHRPSGRATISVELTDQAKYLDEQCSKGMAYACTVLASGFTGGPHLPEDRPRAVNLWRRACDLGDLIGCRNLASEEAFGTPPGIGAETAVAWLRKACDQKDEHACLWLGSAYSNEKLGLKRNPSESRRLFELGCNNGAPSACFYFAFDVFAGEPDSAAAGRAERAYLLACDFGDATACHNLGNGYWFGEHVPEDEEKALSFWRLACDHEAGFSCGQLAELYYLGFTGTVTVPQDFEKALGLYRKAASLGHAPSQTALGRALATGDGFSADTTEAARWLAQAAEHDEPAAQVYLARLLVRGDGVNRDDVAAMMWLTIALDSLDEDAAFDWVDEARKLLDSMKGWMTPKEIAEAQKRVAERKSK